MTEYELYSAISYFNAQSVSTFALFFTQISGYLLVAYLLGAKLSRSQISILNLIYVLTAVLEIWIVFGGTSVAATLAEELRGINPETPVTVNMGTAYLASAILVFALLASLKFMWDVRRKATKS